MIKGSKHSEESKLKNSKSHKGKMIGDLNPSKRPEVREKISKALKESLWNRGRTSEDDSRILAGINHYSYGKHLSEDHKRKITESCKGKIKSKEHKEKLSKSHKGKIPWWIKGKSLSDDHKRKISEGNKGKHRSIESKKKISESKIGKGCGKNNGMYGKSGKNSPHYGKPAAKLSGIGHGCYYESPLQGKIWLRSTYELAYAKYLDDNKILWYYEIETFDLGDTTYTPDFFLPKYDKFIEVKGYMHKSAQNKINKFFEQYPFDLEILYKDDLIKLGVEL